MAWILVFLWQQPPHTWVCCRGSQTRTPPRTVSRRAQVKVVVFIFFHWTHPFFLVSTTTALQLFAYSSNNTLPKPLHSLFILPIFQSHLTSQVPSQWKLGVDKNSCECYGYDLWFIILTAKKSIQSFFVLAGLLSVIFTWYRWLVCLWVISLSKKKYILEHRR